MKCFYKDPLDRCENTESPSYNDHCGWLTNECPWWQKKESDMNYTLDNFSFVPTRAHRTDAGIDLRSPIDFIIWPKCSKVVDVGVHLFLPENSMGLVLCKSGLNVKHGIICLGLVDEGYTGSIKVRLYNTSWRPYRVMAGDKIAQVATPVALYPNLVPTKEIPETDRGNNGFGSTGR